MAIKPPLLNKGDRVAIVAPAGRIKKSDMDRAAQKLSEWGLVVQFSRHLFDGHHQFSSTDKNRISDLQEALDDPQLKAIFCARGGYGTTRIVDFLDLGKIRNAPKWLIGFSDITAIHAHLHNAGIQSAHGIMPSQLGMKGTDQSGESLRRMLFEGSCNPVSTDHILNRAGEGTGALTGGNLALFDNLIGTSTDIDTQHKILFLEDTGEYYYRLDRMMVHLKRSNKLSGLAGLLLGQFTEMKDGPVPYGKTAYGIISEHVEEYDFPVMYDFPAGHGLQNMALPMSGIVTLTVQNRKATISFSL